MTRKLHLRPYNFDCEYSSVEKCRFKISAQGIHSDNSTEITLDMEWYYIPYIVCAFLRAWARARTNRVEQIQRIDKSLSGAS